jgi:hypothetical protein
VKVGKKILGVTELATMVWTCKENARKHSAMESFRMGMRRKRRPKERWMDGVRRTMTNHGLREDDATDRDVWRNLVLGEGKPLQSVKVFR